MFVNLQYISRICHGSRFYVDILHFFYFKKEFLEQQNF